MATIQQIEIKEHTLKALVRGLFLLPALIAGLGLIPAGRVTAQTFTALHEFTGAEQADGEWPDARLILSGATLYGTTILGGELDEGTVFKVDINGSNFHIVHGFNGFDGKAPRAGLILSGSTLYGTTHQGMNGGTVFKVNTDGTQFTTLHAFEGSIDGAVPLDELVLSGSTLYGMTSQSGSGGGGTVFKVNTDGTGFMTVYSFTPLSGYDPNLDPDLGPTINSDGYYPMAGLILSGNILYGTTSAGGDFGYGTVFSFDINSAVLTTLHSLNGDSDGANPYAGLILSGTKLYGTAMQGGGPGKYGTIFSCDINSMAFATLHSIPSGSGGPHELFLSGTTLYGTTSSKVFSFDIMSMVFATLHDFNSVPGGGQTTAGVILSGNTLYGTTMSGGSLHKGTVFSLTLPASCAPAVLTIATFNGFSWLDITGTVGCSYTLEWSPNSGNTGPWTALTTVTLQNSSYSYMDPTPIANNRFYRAVLVP